jgi:hypothetical protein
VANDKIVHYNRVIINEARKLWEEGETIYCFPIYSRNDDVVDGIYISMFTNKEKDSSFDDYVNKYKSLSRNNMRYYTQSFLEE